MRRLAACLLGCFGVWARASLVLILSALVSPAAAAARAVVDRQWSYVGPFPSGKSELDADPLGAVPGGAFAAVNETGAAFPSELVVGGAVGWTLLRADAGGVVSLAPRVDWNDLVRALSRVEVLEHVGFAVGAVTVTGTRAPARVRVSCHGVVAFSLDGTRHAGDIYRTGRVASYVTLPPGRHPLLLRVRAKAQGAFGCDAAALPAGPTARQPLVVSPPSVAPDVEEVTGEPWGDVIGVPVANAGDGPLAGVSCVAFADADDAPLQPSPPPASNGFPFPLAAGASATIPCTLVPPTPTGAFECRGGAVALAVAVTAWSCRGADGVDAPCHAVAAPPLRHSLRCRSLAQSAALTFIDHDGSPQAASFVPPLPLGAGVDGRRRDGRAVVAGTGAASLPVLLTLHGTGVAAGGQADAYKAKPRGAPPDTDYTFGVEGFWVLAPGRHGAHNHAGVGQWHAFAAVDALVARVAQWRPSPRGVAAAACPHWRAAPACLPPPDPRRLLFAGHSMGGYGAWLAAAAAPDRAVAAAPAAGWLVKESYGDANTFNFVDAGEAAVEPALAAALLRAVRDQRADAAAAALVGVPTHARVGGADATTHPFQSRRMVRLLREAGAGGAPEAPAGNSTWPALEEVPTKPHWWWDTDEPNDGGALNDARMRAFYRAHAGRLSTAAALAAAAEADAAWDAAGSAAPPPAPLTTLAPAFRVLSLNAHAHAGGRAGITVLQAASPHAAATVDVSVVTIANAGSGVDGSTTAWLLSTRNVRRLRWSDPRDAAALARVTARAPEGAALCSAAIEHGVAQLADAPLRTWLPAVLCVDGRAFAVAGLADSDLCARPAGRSWALCRRDGVDAEGGGGMRYAHDVSAGGPMVAAAPQARGWDAAVASAAAGGDAFSADFGFEATQRGPHNAGPMRAVAAAPFVIVVGTRGGERATAAYTDAARLLSSLHGVAWDAVAPIVNDTDLAAWPLPGGADPASRSPVLPHGHNIILLGGPAHNAWTAALYCGDLAQAAPAGAGVGVSASSSHFAAGCPRSPSFPIAFDVGVPSDVAVWGGWSVPSAASPCGAVFRGPGLGVLSTVGWWDGRGATAAPAIERTAPGPPLHRPAHQAAQPRARLALLVAATDAAGLDGLLRLAEPTIPPMVRAPFANLFPDVVVADAAAVRRVGVAGLRAVGTWDAEWAWSTEASYIAPD